MRALLGVCTEMNKKHTPEFKLDARILHWQFFNICYLLSQVPWQLRIQQPEKYEDTRLPYISESIWTISYVIRLLRLIVWWMSRVVYVLTVIFVRLLDLSDMNSLSSQEMMLTGLSF